jgi:hypothetical protein
LWNFCLALLLGGPMTRHTIQAVFTYNIMAG